MKMDKYLKICTSVLVFEAIFPSFHFAGGQCTRAANSDIEIHSFPTDISGDCGTVIIKPHNMTALSSSDSQYFPPTLQILVVEDGPLGHVEDGTFSGTTLEGLHLGLNELQEIPNLQDIAGSLLELNLTYNSIAQLRDELTTLELLDILDLSYNSLTSVGDVALCGTRVRILNITGNDLQIVPNLGCINPYLRYLLLGENDITNINDSFTGVTNLRQLDLRENGITGIYSQQFVSLTQLRDLTLTNNPITAIENDAFCHTDMRYLKLNNLQLSAHPDLSCIAESLLWVTTRDQSDDTGISDYSRAVPLPNINHLEIEIAQQPGDDLAQMINSISTYLSLICHRISRVPDLDLTFLQNASHLAKLRIARCDLISTPDFTVIPSTSALHHLNIMWNSMTTIPEHVFDTLRNLTELYIGGNPISAIHHNALLHQYDRLEKLFIDRHNRIDLAASLFSSFTRLGTLSLHTTSTTQFPDLSGSLSTVEYLYLKNTNLDLFDSSILPYMRNLRHLDLTGSLNAAQILTDISDLMYEGNLTAAKLSDNEMLCTCEHYWLRLFMDGAQRWKVKIEGLTCVNPYVFRGLAFQNFSASDMCPNEEQTPVLEPGVLPCAHRCMTHEEYECTYFTYDNASRLCAITYQAWRRDAPLSESGMQPILCTIEQLATVASFSCR